MKPPLDFLWPGPERVVETLQAARKLLSKPERWTKLAYAEDANGDTCPIGSDRATCWCLVGALRKVGAPLDAYHEVQAVVGGSIFAFNDKSTHTEVLRALDRAVERAGKRHG